ncbi:MAG TPA: nitrite transporter NirC [Hyphomicrobiaceae bacterium]|nr:nitrite transporter NirC [Hyphomicrobiaceae bacterium]
MYQKTIEQFAELAAAKAQALRRNPLGFLIASAMAGAYVGVGILLIFSVGQAIDPSVRSLVMGASFGIALTLVVFAGSELFTGHTMFMAFGMLRGTISARDLQSSWALTWIGNLFGSALLAGIFYLGGGGQILKEGADLIFKVADYKMNSPALALVARGILCNWLVCLALWTSARATSDSAKCILIFWCLFAFIACGFEHSVANMTIFSVALLGNHPPQVSLVGMLHNLAWVTLGNAIAGVLFMAGAYRWASEPLSAWAKSAPRVPAPAE